MATAIGDIKLGVRLAESYWSCRCSARVVVWLPGKLILSDFKLALAAVVLHNVFRQLQHAAHRSPVAH